MRRESGGRGRFMVARLIAVTVGSFINSRLRNSISARTAPVGTSKSITLLLFIWVNLPRPGSGRV